MSEADEGVVAGFFQCFSRRDVEGALELLHADAELYPMRAQLDGAVYHGADGYRQLLEDFDEDWDDLEVTPDEISSVGDAVVVAGRIQSRGRTSGVEVDVPVGLVCRVRDGLVAYVRTYSTSEDAVDAAEPSA